MAQRSPRKLTDLLYNQVKKNGGSGLAGEIVVLESQQSGHPSSVQTFIAAYPSRYIYAYGDEITLYDGEEEQTIKADPWEMLKKFRDEKKGWLFGYLGYDLKNFVENLESTNRSPIRQPDLFMMEPSILVKIADGGVETIIGPEQTPESADHPPPFSVDDLQPGISREEYIKTVEKIKEQIKEGDFYELNYSYAINGRFDGDSYGLYQKMRKVNPVPFGAYLKLKDLEICSASPERFLQKRGRRLISEPIKGTSARSAVAEDDSRFKEDLMNEKNRAENLMIVDLVRHDFSRVAKTGTVEVSKLYDIQTFDTVHQLISRVEGELDDNVDAIDAIKACYPMGSMTGAPKYRVMQEIDHHENYRRGIYSGAIGYITPEDDVDFSVVIRTAIIQDSKLIYPVGGAITSDSDAVEEWEETKIKARTIFLASENE